MCGAVGPDGVSEACELSVEEIHDAREIEDMDNISAEKRAQAKKMQQVGAGKTDAKNRIDS